MSSVPAPAVASVDPEPLEAPELNVPEVSRPAGVVVAPPRPKLFYGWLMLPTATLVMVASSPGQTFGFSFFNPEFIATLSISKTTLSATYLVATLLAAVPLSYVGAMTDRFGLRSSLLATVGAMSGACLLAASVQNLPMLFATFVVMRMVGPGALVLLANNTLAAWFDRRLGIVSGAMQLGMACAVALVPWAAVLLIDSVGWRLAYVAMAAVLGAGLLPLVWLVYRDSPDHVGQHLDGLTPTPADLVDGQPHPPAAATSYDRTLAEAASTPAFWIFIVATGAWALIGTGIVFHMESMFLGEGMSTKTAAWAPTLLAVGMATTQILGGILADRIVVRWLVVGAMGGIAASCCVAAGMGGRAMLPAFAIYGCAQGLMTVLAGTAWARFFGRRHLGRIRGVALTAAVASSSAGPLVMGVSADYLGSFTPALWGFAVLAAAIGVAGFWVRRPPLAA